MIVRGKYIMALGLMLCALSAQAELVDGQTGFALQEMNSIGKTADRHGNAQGAYLFDGVDDYLSVAPDYSLNAFTVAMHFRVDEQREWQRLFDFGHGAGGGDIFTSVNHGRFGGQIGSTVHQSAHQYVESGSGIVPVLGEWYHMATTFDGDSRAVRLYIDGVLATEYTATTSMAQWSTGQNWGFGRGNWNDPMFKGAMSDIVFVEGEMSAVQVAQLAADVPSPLLPMGLALSGLAFAAVRRRKIAQ